MSVESIINDLGIPEGLLWFLVPAALQWFILQKTRAGRRWLRWVLLLVLWVPLQVVLANVLLVGGGGLLAALILQLEFSSFLSGTARLTAWMLLAQWRLFVRFGLLLAGWGSAWALDRARPSFPSE